MGAALFDLTGKTALVTGGGRGIGLAVGRVFAGAGARVMLADIDAEEAARSAQILAEIQPGCAAIAVDVADEPSVRAAVQGTIRQLGRIDILVNNAGINT